jgi:hypothetical protein
MTTNDVKRVDTQTLAYTPIRTTGELKTAVRQAKEVFVWVNCFGDDGEYIRVTKTALLVGMGIDTPNDGAHGGRMDETPCRARLEANGLLYID